MFKDKLLQERNKEINEIIIKLEQESNLSSSDITKIHRQEIERLKTIHCAALKEIHAQGDVSVENSINLTKLNEELNSKNRKLMKELFECQAMISVKENKIKDQQIQLQRLEMKEVDLLEQIRKEFEFEVETKQHELNQIKIEFNSLNNQKTLLQEKYNLQSKDFENERVILGFIVGTNI